MLWLFIRLCLKTLYSLSLLAILLIVLVCSVVICSVICSEEMSAWSFVCVVRCRCRDVHFQIPDPVQASKMKLKRCFTTLWWKMINFL